MRSLGSFIADGPGVVKMFWNCILERVRPSQADEDLAYSGPPSDAVSARGFKYKWWGAGIRHSDRVTTSSNYDPSSHYQRDRSVDNLSTRVVLLERQPALICRPCARKAIRGRTWRRFVPLPNSR